MGRRWIPLTTLALACVALGAGCSSPPPPPPPAAPSPVVLSPGDHRLTTTWADETRTYEVHVPPSYRPGTPMPLVVAMHHRGGTADEMRRLTGLDSRADQHGFLVLYPNGSAGAMNAMICCGSKDDVGFVRSVVERLIADGGVDPDRIYATGISNGADMAFRLSVEAPGLFAAIAPVSGGFVGAKAANTESFRPSTPVSVVSFVGSRDGSKDNILSGLDVWQRRVGCSPAPVEWLDPTMYRFVAACTDGSEVVSYVVIPMAHQWPGGASVDGLGDPDRALKATDVMWDFFARHPRLG